MRLHRRFSLTESVTVHPYLTRYFHHTVSKRESLKPAVEDTDPGPAESWEINCGCLWAIHFIDYGGSYRRAAYTMWDSARLDRWGALKTRMPVDRWSELKYYNQVNREISDTLFRRLDI